jgi:hypothetical protein
LRIEIRLPDSTDSNPLSEYCWLWSGERISVNSGEAEFPEPGVRRFEFEFGQTGTVQLSLRNVYGPMAGPGPKVKARIRIDVNEMRGIED